MILRSSGKPWLMACNPDKLAPLLSMLTLSGRPLLPMALVKKLRAASVSHFSDK